MHIDRYLKTLYAGRGKLRRVRFIIVWAEGKDATYACNWRLPAHSGPAHTRRGALNLTTSGFQNLNRRAREGWRTSVQSIKTRFFATLEATLEKPRGVIREPERWHNDGARRLAFLKELGLQGDILPAMVGLGSSFSYSRTLPSGSQTRERFEMVEPRDARVTFMQKVVSEHPKIFGADERAVTATLACGELAPRLARARFNP